MDGRCMGDGVLSQFNPVCYVGRVNCSTGYGQAARHQLWVLRQFHGLRCRIVDAGSVGDPDPQHRSVFVQHAKASSPGADAPRGTIIHLAPNCAVEWLSKTPGPHVLVSVWETTRLPLGWAEHCNRFDQVWCATRWQYGVYADSGVDLHRLRVVPFAIDPALYDPDSVTPMNLRPYGVPDGAQVFGSVFQWTARKAPDALIGGFIQAFDGYDDVVLVIKSCKGDHLHMPIQREVEEIIARFRPSKKAPKIVTVSEQWTADQVLAFYRALHCLVQPHRGEGFGLPIAEALLMDCPTIATAWSAPAEYGAGCILPIGYTLEPPHSMNWQPFYTTDQEWAAPDVGGLSRQLRNVYLTRPMPVRDRIARKFSQLIATTGMAAEAALQELLG